MTIPNGIYAAEFVCIDEYQLGLISKPKWFWRFKITGGSYAGQTIGKASACKPTDENAAGRLVRELTTAVDGKPLAYGEFAAVLYEGEKVRLLVHDGAIWEVMPPRIIRVRVWG